MWRVRARLPARRICGIIKSVRKRMILNPFLFWALPRRVRRVFRQISVGESLKCCCCYSFSVVRQMSRSITNENYTSKSHLCTHKLGTELNNDDIFSFLFNGPE